MRTLTQAHFQRAREMEYLNMLGQARPVGKVRAGENLQWVAADPVGNIIKIGLMLKDRVRMK